MRYERSALALREADEAPGGRGGRLRRALPIAVALACLAGGGVAAGVVASAGSGPTVAHGPVARAVADAFLQANVLSENLGAPPPAGLPSTSAAWALTADPLVRDAHGRAHLARPEHPWVGADGNLVRLGPGDARRLLALQTAQVRRCFTGSARAEQLQELGALVAGEAGRGALVSPGGARVAQWYTLQVSGAVAHVEARVADWEQHDAVVGAPGARRVVASFTTGAVDAKATLVRVGGRWKIASWSRAPWQEPT